MAEPKYQQIAAELQRRIESGDLPANPDDPKLPTEIELMQEYDASRNTVRDAIKLLTTRGLIETRPGRGTFVVEKVSPFVTTLTGDPGTSLGGGEGSVYVAEVKRSGRTATSSDPRVESQPARREVAQGLGIGEGTRVVSRHQRRYIDGKPWSLQTSFYPMTLVDKGAEKLRNAQDIEEGTVTYLADTLGIKQAGYQDTIAVRAPDANETAFFRLPEDGRVAVFVVSRVSFDENGDRFRLTITVYPSDRNEFLINVGEVPAAARRPDPDGRG
jgi:GntR family transcriptional regulator